MFYNILNHHFLTLDCQGMMLHVFKRLISNDYTPNLYQIIYTKKKKWSSKTKNLNEIGRKTNKRRSSPITIKVTTSFWVPSSHGTPAKFLIPEGNRIFRSLCLVGLPDLTREFGRKGPTNGLPGSDIPRPKCGFS